MLVYIAGPMAGLPSYNYPAFQAAADKIRADGRVPLDPSVTFGGDTTLPPRTYYRAGIQLLLLADGIHMLRGWQKSRGATLEHMIAMALDYTITYEAEENDGNIRRPNENGEA